jgi:hypothetical protein
MEFAFQPIERSANVIQFALSIVMFSLAQPSSAKIESQDGKPKTVQRFHGMKYHFVVKCPAERRMRMANKTSVSSILCASIQQGFESADWSLEKE